MRTFSSVRLGVTPEINAICTILIGIVSVGVLVWSLAMKRALARQIEDQRAAERGAAAA
jgi:putrescine transport system permease protein